MESDRSKSITILEMVKTEGAGVEGKREMENGTYRENVKKYISKNLTKKKLFIELLFIYAVS